MTLGYIDVAPDVLTGGGGSLHKAIGEDRRVEDHVVDIAGLLPETGWRLIHRSAADGERGGSEVFAAPCADDGGGWAMATLSSPRTGGDWILSADPGPFRVFPGRAARRAALSLTWPTGLSAAAGSMPQSRVCLRNETHRVWSNDPGDSAHVQGWLLAANGHRLEDSRWFAFAHGRTLPTLKPGDAVLLDVVMAAFDYDTLKPGTYRLEAILIALDLRSAAGSIALL